MFLDYTSTQQKVMFISMYLGFRVLVLVTSISISSLGVFL